MKILLVSLYLVEYAVELANALGKNNQVHLLLSEHRVGQTIGKHLNEKLKGNISYTLLKKRSLWSPSTWKSIYSILKILITSKYDVVHLQECANPFNLLFLVFSFKPVIITIHDVLMHPGSEASITPWKLWGRGKLIKYGYDKVIVHGENLKILFLEHYEKPSKDVFVVPHGCLFSFRQGNNAQEIEEEPHTVLFFGRMERYKGLRYLMEAEPLVSTAVPDFKIVVAGTGEDLKLHKSSLSSNPRFEVHDRFIPNEEVSSFFKRASLVVLPYIEASQSGVTAMAFAFGKPVIVTDVGSLAEVVQDGKAGIIVPPRDTEKLAHAIADLLTNREKRLEMGREALHLAETALSWNHISSLTEHVYKQSLN